MRADLPTSRAYPGLRGLESYAGPTMRLSRARDEIDVTGLRVAVIGVDATTVRCLPELARQARTLKLFQHTPQWVLPAAKGQGGIHVSSVNGGALRRRLAQWHARRHLHRQVEDPWLRRQLQPQHPVGADQPVSFSDAFYPALMQPHCELVTWPIDRLCEDGIRTCDGLVHEVDCVIVAG